jgi:hypothetical protein
MNKKGIRKNCGDDITDDFCPEQCADSSREE